MEELLKTLNITLTRLERFTKYEYGEEAHFMRGGSHPEELWVRPFASLRPRDEYFHRWFRADDEGRLWICEFFTDSSDGITLLTSIVEKYSKDHAR